MRIYVLLTLVPAVVLLAHANPAAPRAATERAGATLASRLQEIESAVRKGDAGGLRASFVTSGKVRADLKDFTSGQTWYGPGQLQVIFGQIFDEYQTREFAFPNSELTLSSPGTAFARGRWVRCSHRGGPEIVATLTVTLQAERGDWRILEIRSSR
jgi:hypothetical protein